MLKFELNKDRDEKLKILCLGAHSDDIEIGCGGTVLKMLSEYNNIDIHWVVFSADKKRSAEAQKSAKLFLANAGQKKIVVKNFRESFFPYVGVEIKDYFEKLKPEVAPDIIFTPYRNDLHQDHRLISELTWNTFRNQLIIEYEIIKYDGDLGIPNFFVHLDEAICQKKVDIIMQSFKSQKSRDWFTEDAFSSILRIRGIESKAPDKYAEAFYCRKLVI
jgi:LmbE family N-acetylglucosaminyl deacetylase